jgi:hypothetical protein
VVEIAGRIRWIEVYRPVQVRDRAVGLAFAGGSKGKENRFDRGCGPLAFLLGGSLLLERLAPFKK